MPRLQKITRAAGTIFAGVVTSVRSVPASQGREVNMVQITFHVVHAIRGVRTGDTLTIREWAGLWTAGERYRVGEHVLLFLYPPSKLGLTSPVGGPMGRFVLDQADLIVLKPAQPGGPISGHPGGPRLRPKDRLSFQEFSRAVRRAAEE